MGARVKTPLSKTFQLPGSGYIVMASSICGGNCGT